MNRIDIEVSEPQMLFAVTKSAIREVVAALREDGVNVHEFSTSYVRRTVELGYAPDLEESVRSFCGQKGAA